MRITAGPLAGREDTLVRPKGGLRLLLLINPIQRSISLDINATILERADPC